MSASPESPEIRGECHPRFGAVREVFAENFRTRNELGAGVAVVHDGALVVDLWAGYVDEERSRPWQRDTLANVYSCTKAMTALCAHRLVEEGRLDLDAPVARYWPEFGQAGKAEIRVRWLLSHRSGVPAVKPILPSDALYDWEAMTTALELQEPWWTPGTQHGYHALTFGWLVGEVVRRITGKSLGAYFRDEIARPLALDFHIGLPAADHARCADLTAIPLPAPDAAGPQLGAIIMSDPEGMPARAFLNPPSIGLGPNHAAWRSAEIPGANGHGTARDLARVYGVLARGGEQDGVHLLDAAGLARCCSEESRGPDPVLQLSTRFGSGFMLSQDQTDGRFSPSRRAFGHPGAGGSLGFADLDTKIGFGYVVNRLGPHVLTDPRAVALSDAVYASLR